MLNIMNFLCALIDRPVYKIDGISEYTSKILLSCVSRADVRFKSRKNLKHVRSTKNQKQNETEGKCDGLNNLSIKFW